MHLNKSIQNTPSGKAELDVTDNVSKLCHGQLSHCGKTNNTNAHLACYRAELKTKQAKLDGTLNKFSSGSQKSKTNDKDIYTFHLQSPPPV